MTALKDDHLIEITALVVSAYVENNRLPIGSLSDLVASVSGAIGKLGEAAPVEAPLLKPAVNPKKSVFPDYIVSLEDGKKYKSLRRHLSAKHGMTPDEYRSKWGLSADYPMVAPNYSASRSALAKKLGLGGKPAVKTKASRVKRK